MKNFIKENWFKIGLLSILVIFITGAFYWFEWRPIGIRKYCFQQTIAKENYPGRGQNTYFTEERMNITRNYEDCLIQFGLK